MFWWLASALTVQDMLSYPITYSPFSFAHAVWDAHHHDDAFVTCRLRGAVCEDPTSRLFLMGPDFVRFRNEFEAVLALELTGRLLYHDHADPDLDFSNVTDARTGVRVSGALKPTKWPVRPTVEMIGAVVAVWADETAMRTGAQLDMVEVWESSRSGAMLDRDGIDGAHGIVQRWFGTTTPSADSDAAAFSAFAAG